MERTIAVFGIILATSPVHGVVFSGTGDLDLLFFTTEANTPTVIGDGEIEIELEPGLHLSSEINISANNLLGPFTSTEVFANPDFTTDIYNITIEYNQITASLSLGPGPVTSSGAALSSEPILLGGQFSLAGSYSIEGPSTSVSDTFDISIPLVGSPTPISPTLGFSNIDFPNSLDVSLAAFFSPPLQNSVLFNETVDGRQFSNEISTGVGIGASGRSITVTAAVPEPSSSALAWLAMLLVLRRRRKT